MIEKLLMYCLEVWFVFYLINYAGFSARVINAVIPQWIAYPFHCSLCFTYWLTLIVGIGLRYTTSCSIPHSFLLTAPVVVMFIDLHYRKLRADTAFII